jgi:TonB family protein
MTNGGASKRSFLSIPAFLVVAACAWQAAGASAPPSGGQAAATGGGGARLQDAQALLDEGQPQAAAKAFAAANEAAGGRCGRCLLGLAKALDADGQPKEAVAALRAAIAALAGDPLLGRANLRLGDALVRLDAGSQTATEAEAAYAEAMRVEPALAAEAWAGTAEARLQRSLYVDAVNAAQKSLAVARSGKSAGKARSAVCRARRGDAQPSKAFLLPSALPMPSPPSAPDPGIYRVGTGVTKPEKAYAPPPLYTAAARQQKLQGVVILEAVIDEEGCVAHDKVLKALDPGLDRSAMAAVESWVFNPATLNGRPVKVYYTLTINFQAP